MLSDKISEGTYYFVFQMSDKAVDVELKIGDVAPRSRTNPFVWLLRNQVKCKKKKRGNYE